MKIRCYRKINEIQPLLVSRAISGQVNSSSSLIGLSTQLTQTRKAANEIRASVQIIIADMGNASKTNSCPYSASRAGAAREYFTRLHPCSISMDKNRSHMTCAMKTID